jgi:uncharacterized protein (TIGR00269 family)
MKCRRCGAKAEVALRAHNTAFCRACFVLFFERQVDRSIAKNRMFSHSDRVLVAVSGGKDSLALWHVLATKGYQTTGLHLSLGIGGYSALSREKTEEFARVRGLPLIVRDLRTLDGDLSIPTVAAFTNRRPCAACGTIKRHCFDRAALEHGFTVLATGHNLDDEAARLLGNVLHWQREHLARQRPVLRPSHPKFVTKVRPLYLLSEFEAAAYSFFHQIDYVVDECPNSVGATQLVYKATLNRLEADMAGTKHGFVRDFQRIAQPVFEATEKPPEGECSVCCMPSYGATCSFCTLVAEVRAKRERASATA